MRLERWLALLACIIAVFAQDETENEESRKVLGSSVVTSVSVIMDHGNGTKTYLTDADGQPLDQGDGVVGSPIDLLNPDRYEFYTFDETGDLVKRLMTLDQIKGLLATGDGETLDGPSSSPNFYHDSLSSSHLDDTDLDPNMAQGVHSVVASVQNVLKSELEATKIKGANGRPPLTIPDSISSWSMLFPAIISDAEALDDGSSSGNNVNEPIDAGDRLPASSNEEKTEIRVPQEQTNSKIQESSTVTEKPTVVPPIIHFLEIHSVPSPAKNPTRTPINLAATTTSPVTDSTSKLPTTTDNPTSPFSPMQEMSASISSLLSQVTDDYTMSDDLVSEEKSKIATKDVPLPTTERVIQLTKESDKTSSDKTPQNSNIDEVTKKPLEIQSESTTISRNKGTTQHLATISTTTEGNIKPSSDKKTENKNDESEDNTKKTADKVVSFVTTSKPTGTMIIKSKPTILGGNKQKIQSTTPSTIKNSNTKNPSISTKKPTKPLVTVSNVGNGIETLEAHSTEDVLKITPNKSSATVPAANKIKNNNQTKTNVSSSKLQPKPHKKIPNKPHATEESPDCNNSKKTPPSSDLKVNEKLEFAASSNLNEQVKPSKLKPTELQEITIIQKPASVQSTKPAINKIKPSDDVKITTYKPSTSQPFTTKQSINKISTTTQQPISENKISSASKIHEVNSSLLHLKEHVINFESNKTQTQNSNKLSSLIAENHISISNVESAASNIDQPTNTVPNKDELLHSLEAKNGTSDVIDHSAEIECTHSKKPIHTSIQDKISDLTHELAASNSEEIKLTTVPNVSTTDPSREATTEFMTESPTKLLPEDLITTTELLRETATDLPETTTLNMPDVDFVKEGISAVTNILLDLSPPLEPQLPLPTIPLSESASSIVLSPPVKGEVKHAAPSVSVDALEMTTTDSTEEKTTGESSSSEKELLVYFTTTELPATETVPPTTDYTLGDTKNVSIEDKTDKVTNIDTTEEIATTEEIDKKQPSESKVVIASVNKQTLPTKESKLGPENVDESSDSSVSCNQTLTEINYTNALNMSDEIKNTSDSADQLEPAQSIMLEINKINAVTKSPSTTTPVETTPKSAIKNEKPSLDFKTATKPDFTKFTQAKYPTVQSAFRPLPESSANPPAVELHPAPHESMGLEATTAFLADDVRRFSDLCNELAFRMWTSITGKGSISSRSLVLSPFATTSLLAMVFLGARGPTSGQMNDVLRLDDMVTFNPHQVLQNVTESVLNSRNYGVTTAAFVRELYSDKLKGKILDFYKERAQQYYDGHVEEISFNLVGDILRRRTNLLVKRQTLGKVPEYLRGGSLSLRPPLAAFSANIFQTDCDLASTEGRDGEMYFVVRPSTRQRRLVPVPAAVWRTGFLAGYEPGLDATAVALGTDSVVSTVMVLPGQQGQVAPGDGLARLEQRLIETSYRRGGWTRLLRSLLPRPGLELQVPRFSHRSVLNITSTLQRMGLKDLFNENKADLRGLNGLSNDLHLSDMVQVNTFSTCGEDTIGAKHHIESYPVSPQRMGRDDPEFYPRPEDFEDPELFKIPLNLRPRQARLPDSPRLRFDRPFLYMVRHNPTGMILHMGRFNPRLLP